MASFGIPISSDCSVNGVSRYTCPQGSARASTFDSSLHIPRPSAFAGIFLSVVEASSLDFLSPRHAYLAIITSELRLLHSHLCRYQLESRKAPKCSWSSFAADHCSYVPIECPRPNAINSHFHWPRDFCLLCRIAAPLPDRQGDEEIMVSPVVRLMERSSRFRSAVRMMERF